MSISTNDLFIGAISTDEIGALRYDDAMFGAGADTFAGADSDVLLFDGADAHTIETDDGFDGASDDVDVISVSSDSDTMFDVSDDSFDDDSGDLLGDDTSDIFLGD